MTNKTRKKYSAEFKREAVRLVENEGYKVAEAARSLDINANMLGRWVQEAREGADSAFPGKGRLSPDHEEIGRLRAENKRLRLEKEILKKATAFFAKEGS
jgi:transposase